MTNKQAYAGLLAKLLFKVPSGHADFKLINPDGPEAAEAISSLLKRVEDAVITLIAVRATTVSPEWSESARHFHDLCGETIKRCNAALNSDAPHSSGTPKECPECVAREEAAKRAYEHYQANTCPCQAAERYVATCPKHGHPLSGDAPLSIGEEQ